MNKENLRNFKVESDNGRPRLAVSHAVDLFYEVFDKLEELEARLEKCKCHGHEDAPAAKKTATKKAAAKKTAATEKEDNSKDA